eukprot:EG_transcript_15113
MCATSFRTIAEAVAFAQECASCAAPAQSPLRATAVGGGALRQDVAAAFAAVGVDLDGADELAAAVVGFRAVAAQAVELSLPEHSDFSAGLAWCRHYEPSAPPSLLPVSVEYPVLLCHAGSGVSILLVSDDEGEPYKRVSGSCLGGATLSALAALLTGETDYRAALRLCAAGDLRRTDLLVGDIYGGACEALGLPFDIIAASFGKAVPQGSSEQPEGNPGDPPSAADPHPGTPDARQRSADLLASLAFMLGNNLAQLACLVADRHTARTVVFAGGMFAVQDALWSYVAFAMQFWSQGARRACFVPHGGLLGAVGALLLPPQTAPPPEAPKTEPAVPLAD